MSIRKILGVEKGIERSISPKRDVVLMPRAHLLQPPHRPEVKPDDNVPMNLDITKLLIRKKEKKRLEKKLKKQKERKERKERKEQGGVARIAKNPGSPLSSSSSSSVSSISSVSISPNDIIAFEEEQRREATRPHQGSPKSVSSSLSPFGRRVSIEEAAEARINSSSSASSSSSSPRFEKFDSWSMSLTSPISPKGKGRQGGGSRRRRRTAHKKRKTHHKSKRIHHTRRKHTRRHRHRR